ncbi:MAG TPA: hypothetical protein VN726_06035 [Hanamia sp.]|nr:hypothetical protein [Hanamia sp.]
MPNNLISVEVASKMTALYRQEMPAILDYPFMEENILPICETFDRTAFDALLDQEGCTSVRIYYGMSDDRKIHAIVVGVNSDNEDILPETSIAGLSGSDTVIIEEAFRCPDYCPPKSPLNS